MLGQLTPSPLCVSSSHGYVLELSCCDAEEMMWLLPCTYLVLEVLDSPGSSPFWSSPWWFGSFMLFFFFPKSGHDAPFCLKYPSSQLSSSLNNSSLLRESGAAGC